MTAEELFLFLIENNFDEKKNVSVKLEYRPESESGVTGIKQVDLQKVEIEDDGTLTLVVED